MGWPEECAAADAWSRAPDQFKYPWGWSGGMALGKYGRRRTRAPYSRRRFKKHELAALEKVIQSKPSPITPNDIPLF